MVSLAVVELAATSSAVPPEYTVVDLGTLGGPQSAAYAINNRGEVVGWADSAVYEAIHPFLWTESTGMTDLGTLGGSWGWATAINDAGQIAGSSIPTGGTDLQAFIYENGAMSSLGTLGHPASHARSINSQGQVVGISYIHGGVSQAFLWQNGVMVGLPSSGGFSTDAWGINDLGHIVGRRSLQDENRACIWLDGVVYDLPDLGETNSLASDINENGQIAGIVGWPCQNALWDEGEVTSLPNLPGYVGSLNAPSINSEGVVVNELWTGRSQHAVLWEDGVGYDLNDLIPPDSGWVLELAIDINDVGQIVGQGYHDGVTRAFLLNPVPEPAASCLFLLGSAWALGRRRSPRRERFLRRS